MDYSQRVKIEYHGSPRPRKLQHENFDNAILCQSIYSDHFQLFIVGTYSVRTKAWFAVFSNDIFNKIDVRGRLVEETSVDQLLEEEFHITKL